MDITKLLENKNKDHNHDTKLNSPKAIIITYKDCMHLSQTYLSKSRLFFCSFHFPVKVHVQLDDFIVRLF